MCFIDREDTGRVDGFTTSTEQLYAVCMLLLSGKRRRKLVLVLRLKKERGDARISTCYYGLSRNVGDETNLEMD